MAKVRRSTPAPVPAAKAPAATAKAAKAKSSASAGAADTAAKSPAAAAASPPIVIEIPSSPDPSVGVGSKGSSGSKKKARKRPAPQLDLDDEIEMWTPRQKMLRDEDCQILARDPFSATSEVASSPATANDEIAVVAERGKVACRDYPHPRSACAKNPFGTTPHERHCDKCFCYVCDIAAPCVSWKGHGGHCHASDKDKKWKTMRLIKKRAQVKPS
ncbi:hypothetical protein SEVIR_9G318100v4 [Setaria viridis]|uniref:Uncharacterized protein n=2 Tax=Setaria viridis TaxID=4556 RepID=A0A4U6SZU9_SETVI|nr:uncharacterized protein LOC117837711 [Setaria viridis]TKV94777.1 hypothetical protein SEVIR_9G318100v2 [Setaria viridis]